MFEKTKHVVMWKDTDGSTWEKDVWAENEEKAKFKAFKILRDEDVELDKKCRFSDFLKNNFVLVKKG